MEWIRPDINLNFVGNRYKAFVLSSILILLGLCALIYRGGLNLGVDFSGGTLIQVQFKKTTSPDEIRSALKDLISQSTVQQIGAAKDNEYLIRAGMMSSEVQSLSETVQSALEKAYGEGQVTVMRVEMVGPKVGHDLRQKALFAIYYALLFIAIYISGRFEFKWASSGIMVAVLIVGVYLLEALGVGVVYLIVGALLVTLVLCWFLKLPYALGAVLSLIHDVLITVGVFALTNKEFTLEVLAAILTLVGFSLNDTIIVYDRIRENYRKSRKEDFKDIINMSINQTLSRTILTSGTVLLVAGCLFVLGGTVIHDFSFALLIGIITGTYSSIYVASPLLILYEDLKKRSPAAKHAKA
ncbi:protein translocase subunit SecF [Desulforhabdus amnigena]|uniref:Protein-export membrane protein SecF n=1 Tax=Desulforhabdus amnigena TaxID=40218 RepID=A0A9W6FSC6_9BACT|nr:protein translocase subunit SecF [Desulforhabdus amnigena]GLI33889.1 protein-export membrane protein SecF [Desulforhabdus amnigena]